MHSTAYSDLSAQLSEKINLKSEVTLDRSLSSAIKGHFCSLLISNIFCYPRFLSLPFAFLSLLQNTLLHFFNKNTVCFDLLHLSKGEFFCFLTFSRIFRSELNSQNLQLQLIYKRVTPPCFYLPNSPCSNHLSLF